MVKPMKTILHTLLPADMTLSRPLPGIQPVRGSWLFIDEAYTDQMQLRADLLAQNRNAVLQSHPDVHAAAQELLHTVLRLLPTLGFRMAQSHVICPDNRRVDINTDEPLATLGHLVQCDFCLLDKEQDEHVLKAGLLCF